MGLITRIRNNIRIKDFTEEGWKLEEHFGDFMEAMAHANNLANAYNNRLIVSDNTNHIYYVFVRNKKV
jgi:hypothetical protein